MLSLQLPHWRQRAQLSQRALARLVGMSHSQVCNIEAGRCGLSVEKLGAVAQAIANHIPDATVGDVLAGLVAPTPRPPAPESCSEGEMEAA